MAEPLVGVVMGSDSDWSVMEDAVAALAEFEYIARSTTISAAGAGKLPRLSMTAP